MLDDTEIPLVEIHIDGEFFPGPNQQLGRLEPSPTTDELWGDFELQRKFVLSREQVVAMGKDPAVTSKFPDEHFGLGDDAYMGALDISTCYTASMRSARRRSRITSGTVREDRRPSSSSITTAAAAVPAAAEAKEQENQAPRRSLLTPSPPLYGHRNTKPDVSRGREYVPFRVDGVPAAAVSGHVCREEVRRLRRSQTLAERAWHRGGRHENDKKAEGCEKRNEDGMRCIGDSSVNGTTNGDNNSSHSRSPSLD